MTPPQMNGFCDNHSENCSNIARLDTRMNKAEKEISQNCASVKELQREKVDKMAFYKAIGIYSVILLASFSFTFGVHLHSAGALKNHIAVALAQCGDVKKRQSEIESNSNVSAFMFKAFGEKLDKIYEQNTQVIFKIEDLDRRVYRLEVDQGAIDRRKEAESDGKRDR